MKSKINTVEQFQGHLVFLYSLKKHYKKISDNERLVKVNKTIQSVVDNSILVGDKYLRV